MQFLSPPDIDHSPDVGMEPNLCVVTGLVLTDNDGVWHWKEPNQCAVLEILQNLTLTLDITWERHCNKNCNKNTPFSLPLALLLTCQGKASPLVEPTLAGASV